MKRLIILAVSFISLPVFGQDKIDEAIGAYFAEWKKGQSVADISERILKLNNEDVLSSVERYTSDTSVNVRGAAYALIDYLGHRTDPRLQKRAVKQLVFGISDRDGGITGTNLTYLTTYPEAMFDAESKYMLAELAKKPCQHYEKLIKICGWLHQTDLIYEFRKMIPEKRGTARDRWAMRLAMARMGEKDMIGYCLQKANQVELGDAAVYELVPDLVYTRQKPLFDYMLEIINSNEKVCSSPNPDSDEKILCAFLVIEQIAPYIGNFPAQVDASGDLVGNNYDKILSDVRNWMKLNRDYDIKKDDF